MCNKTKVLAQYIEGLFEGLYPDEKSADIFVKILEPTTEVKRVYLTEEELIVILVEMYDNGDNEDLEKCLHAVYPHLSEFSDTDINKIYLDILDICDIDEEDMEGINYESYYGCKGTTTKSVH